MSGVAGVGVRAHEIDAGGRYYTPDALALDLVLRLPVDPPALCLEPSAGGGAFVRAMRWRWSLAHIDACEPDPFAPIETYEAAVTCLHRGTYEEAYPAGGESGGPDLVAGNPPYRHAEAHVRRSLEVVRPGGTVAFLLRLGFLESVGRYTRLLRDNPPAHVDVLVRRPAYRIVTGPPLPSLQGSLWADEAQAWEEDDDAGTDASAYAWIQWVRGYTGPTVMGWIP